MVLYGRCDEDILIPYRPIRECLRHYVTSASRGRLAGHDRQRFGEIRRIVPELAQRLPDLPEPTRTDPDAERYLLSSAVARLLDEIADETPLALVLDDLHWADEATLQLLRHIAGTSLGRVLILGTYRDEGLSPGQPLTGAVAALCREPPVRHINLTGLTEPAVVAIMKAMTGCSLDMAALELARALARETGGNAFLVVEQVRHLLERGLLARTHDGRTTVAADLAATELPLSVQQVVAGRLGLLEEAARTVLLIASVIGEQFDLNLLCSACKSGEDDVLDILEAAERRALVTEAADRAGSFRFAHAMVRQVVYQQVGPTRQGRLHTRVGEALEHLCGDDPGNRTAELARHFLAGWPTNAKAALYARLAGERALAALAPDEALRWFTQAVEALRGVTDERERVRCLVGLGDAQRQLGIPGARETLLAAARRARQLGQPQLEIRAALASNRGFFARLEQTDTELVTMLEAALELCQPDGPDRARLLSRLAAELTFDPNVSRRRALADEAVAVARDSGDAAALLDALTRPDTALMDPELSEHRLSRLREAQALTARVDDPVARYWAAHQLGLLLIERADPDGMDHALDYAQEISTQLGQPVLSWASHFARCCQVLLTGDVDEAERLANRALQIGTESGQPDAATIYSAQLFSIRWHQGRLDEDIPVLTHLAAEEPDRGSPAQAYCALAKALSGESDPARRGLRAAADTGFRSPASAAAPG